MMTNEEVLWPTRELHDGVYYRVDVSRDGRIRLIVGPDDQRPEADNTNFFTPIHLREINGQKRPTYCGKCRRLMAGQWNSDRIEWRYCPRCGAGIAHWNWTMGDVEWIPEKHFEDLPDCLPELTDEFRCGFAAAERKRLSGAIASAQALPGKS